MSTCPEKNLYSALVDNEINSPWFETLKLHLEKCPRCQQKFNQMQKMHDLLKDDSSSINLSDKFLTDSFERLQAKKKFVTVNMVSKKENAFVQKILPAMAAAFVLAFGLPFFSRTLSSNQNPELITLKKIAVPTKVNYVSVEHSLPYNVVNSVNVSNFESKIFTDVDIFKPDFPQTDVMNIRLDTNVYIQNNQLTNIKTFDGIYKSFSE